GCWVRRNDHARAIDLRGRVGRFLGLPTNYTMRSASRTGIGRDWTRSAVWQAPAQQSNHTSKTAPCEVYVADIEYRRQSADTMMIAQMLVRIVLREPTSRCFQSDRTGPLLVNGCGGLTGIGHVLFPLPHSDGLKFLDQIHEILCPRHVVVS